MKETMSKKQRPQPAAWLTALLAFVIPGLAAAQEQPASVDALNQGDNFEAQWHVETNEISLTQKGIGAFFAERGLVEAADKAPMYRVGLMLDGHNVQALTWTMLDARGRWTAPEPVVVTWNEGLSHVARIDLPYPTRMISLQRNDAELAFVQIEPHTEQPAEAPLAASLPFETENASVRAPLAPGVVSRAGWGARSTGACGEGHSPKFLTLHHTSTPNNDSISSPARMRQMQAFHIDTRGWCDFAYHYSVGIDGKVYEGRSPDRTGAHVGDWNTNNLGIAVVGTFIGFNPRVSQLDALTSISRWLVNRYGIAKNRTQIKGHKEWSGHTSNDCPGLLLPWLPTLVRNLSDGGGGGGGGGGTAPGVMDSFELGLGRFDSAPTASGSTIGVSTASNIARNNVRVRNGQWSLQVGLRDDTSTSLNWDVRLLSGGGNSNHNLRLQKAGGRVGFWAFTAAPGVTLSLGVDDSDGLERSNGRVLPVNSWTFFEWKLDDQAMWEGFASGNGTITASQVTLDSIFINRAQNANEVFIYVDDVSFRIQ